MRIGTVVIKLGILLLLTITLYVTGQSLQIKAHSEILENIRKIELNETRLNEDLLKSHFGLLKTYDPVIKSSAEIERSIKHLKKLTAPLENSEINAAIANYTKLFNLRTERIKNFKSKNSILKNSLLYFPTTTKKLTNYLQKNRNNSPLATKLSNLSRQVLYYNVNPDTMAEPEIKKNINSLKRLASTLPTSESEQLNIILKHSEIMIWRKHEVDGLISSISMAKTSNAIEKILESYNLHYQKNQYRREIIGLFLSIIMVSLILFVGVTLLKLQITAGALGKSIERISRFNNILNQKVKTRTQNLNDSLASLNELKNQQDGDYFLTSQLVSPLSENTLQSDTLNVDYLQLQKKQFTFRKWNSEIGGDICVAHLIHLKKRPYIVFLNGDAMGKSIQGASGALVLGTLFKSIIISTQQQLLDLDPETWLHHIYKEIQNLMVTFDGKMLISAVFGLINEKTGLLYHVNVEHPESVLYRNGQAKFLKSRKNIHKFGIDVDYDQFQVDVFPMKAGDRIILGSDGRDDLLLGRNEYGRMINENEKLFLKHVEQGHGDLEEIKKALEKTGELTDDLSMMCLHFQGEKGMALKIDPYFNRIIQEGKAAAYKGDYATAIQKREEAQELFPLDYQNLSTLLKLYIRTQNTKRACEIVEILVQDYPYKSRFLLAAARLYKKEGQYEKARDAGERYRLRKRTDTRILQTLSEIYTLMNDPNKVRQIKSELKKDSAVPVLV